MAAATAEIGTLRLRSAAGDTPAARLAANVWLGGAELHPGELPPSAVLIVRRLADPLPGRLPSRGPAPSDPAWERAARSALGDLSRRAARPARGPVPPGAEAVLFADEAEMLACLALDLARGQASGCWWWSLVLRRRGARDLPGLFAAEPARVPAVLKHLERRGLAAEVCGRLAESEVTAVLAVVARSWGAPELARALSAPRAASGSAAQESAETRETAISKTFQSQESATRAAWTPRPAWLRRFASIPGVAWLAPAQRVLLAAGLALFEEPATARGVAFSREIREWWMAGAPLDRPGIQEEIAAARAASREVHQEAMASPVSESVSQPRLDSEAQGEAKPVEVRPDSAVASSPSMPVADVPESFAPRAQESLPEDRHEPATTATANETESKTSEIPRIEGRPEISPPPASQSAESAAIAEEPASTAVQIEEEEKDAAPAVYEEGVPTRIAGLFYLIHLLVEEEWPPAGLGAWALLEGIARALLEPLPEELEMDLVWGVLAHLDGRDPEEPLHPELLRWLSPALPRLRLRLARALGLDPERPGELPPLLLLHPGRVHVTSSHVDVVMDLESIVLPVRLSGLDRDPGWLPAFGRVVQFHFR